MRTLVMFTILCACMVAWGADENVAQKMQMSFYELKIDSMNGIISPKWMNELTLAEPAMYKPGDFTLLDGRRKISAALFASEPKKTGMKMGMIGSIANTGYLNDLPPDSVYMPAEEEGGEGDSALNTREDIKKNGMRTTGMGSIANTGQLGDAPADDAYQGGSSSGSSSNVGSAVQQATEDAKKENARNNMMGSVTNGGQWDDNNGGDYQTDIQPAKKAINVGEDRIPYLVKQLSSPQNANKNPSDIQRDIRRQMMQQQVTQPNPYDDL